MTALSYSFLFITLIALNLERCLGTRIGSTVTPEALNTATTTTRQLQDSSYFDNIDLSEVSLCGCNSCYDRGVGGHSFRTGQTESCAQRIMGLISEQQYSEDAACSQIAKTDFVSECGPICDSELCDGRAELAAKADEPRPMKLFCGCQSCTTDAWVSMAGEFSCGARISYVTDFQGMTEVEACRKVAGQEFTLECGPCDPDTCEEADSTQSSTFADMNDSESQGFAFKPEIPQIPDFVDIPLTPEFPLYCFPAYNDRLRYENLWGKYAIEVKESDNFCGPSDNIFSRRTVRVANDELTLQFKNTGNRWEASEVRLLLPQEEMPFHYGEYSFSVKSVQVIDSTTGVIVGTVLPVSIILGLFSWDSTEDYSRHENYNHEVDVEIARWNIDDLADVQYLVQPPGDPHKYRFFSGEGNTYRQAPHRYSFTWKPAEIDWSSSAGGGQTFTYGAQDALNAMQPDYTQCMPADVEVRMNLWHLFGDSTPRGMEETHMVEVIIDDFQFTPSGLTGLAQGGICTKDCQCQSRECNENKCTAADPSIGDNFGDGTKPFPQGQSSATVDPDAETIPSAQSESGSTGMGKAGKALLTIFFLLLAAVIAVFFIRKKRNNKNVARMDTFTEKFRIMTFSDGHPKKQVVVECWETESEKIDTENVKSFEMSLKKETAKVASLCRGK